MQLLLSGGTYLKAADSSESDELHGFLFYETDTSLHVTRLSSKRQIYPSKLQQSLDDLTLMRIPLEAATPEPTMMAVGVARPSAHGQATTSIVMPKRSANRKALLPAGYHSRGNHCRRPAVVALSKLHEFLKAMFLDTKLILVVLYLSQDQCTPATNQLSQVQIAARITAGTK